MNINVIDEIPSNKRGKTNGYDSIAGKAPAFLF